MRDLFHRSDELADGVREAATPWVITHGQLHTANIVRAKAKGGVPVLVDWDCVAIAPRERDLGRHWGGLAELRTEEDWAAYTSSGSEPGINPAAVDLYWHIGLSWGICVSTGAMRSRHDDGPDSRHMWTMIQSLVGEGESQSSRQRSERADMRPRPR